MEETATDETAATVPATVANVDKDHVVIRTLEGSEYKLAIEDVPDDLQFEGQAVDLLHDDAGFVFSIVKRVPARAPPDIQQTIKEALAWADSL